MKIIRRFKTELYALYLAYRHPGTPWYAKAVIAGVVAYAISPIDLIPDFIPFIGGLDDVVVVSAGVWLSMKLIPKPVYDECRAKAEARIDNIRLAGKWIVSGIVLVLWTALIAAAVMFYLQKKGGI